MQLGGFEYLRCGITGIENVKTVKNYVSRQRVENRRVKRHVEYIERSKRKGKSLGLDVHLHVKIVSDKNPLKGKTVSKSKGRLRGKIVAKIHENVTKYIV